MFLRQTIKSIPGAFGAAFVALLIAVPAFAQDAPALKDGGTVSRAGATSNEAAPGDYQQQRAEHVRSGRGGGR